MWALSRPPGSPPRVAARRGRGWRANLRVMCGQARAGAMEWRLCMGATRSLTVLGDSNPQNRRSRNHGEAGMSVGALSGSYISANPCQSSGANRLRLPQDAGFAQCLPCPGMLSHPKGNLWYLVSERPRFRPAIPRLSSRRDRIARVGRLAPGSRPAVRKDRACRP